MDTGCCVFGVVWFAWFLVCLPAVVVDLLVSSGALTRGYAVGCLGGLYGFIDSCCWGLCL